MTRPLVGIVVDNLENKASSGRYEVSAAYSRCVAESGGVPILLPHEPDLADQYACCCDALVLTGGVDPDTATFGQLIHPMARPMDPRRQACELALLEAAKRQPDMPVLGVCLGMQLMALHSGGRLDQYLPASLPDAHVHQDEHHHSIVMRVNCSVLSGAKDEAAVERTVVSSHRQAVVDSGSMRVLATAPDGVIEAIDDPARSFYLGVQWHPERSGVGPLGSGLFERLVQAGRR